MESKTDWSTVDEMTDKDITVTEAVQNDPDTRLLDNFSALCEPCAAQIANQSLNAWAAKHLVQSAEQELQKPF